MSGVHINLSCNPGSATGPLIHSADLASIIEPRVSGSHSRGMPLGRPYVYGASPMRLRPYVED